MKYARSIASSNHSASDSRLLAEIADGHGARESGIGEFRADRFALHGAMLEQQPAARAQEPRRFAHDVPDRIETVAARYERALGLVAQRFQMRIADRDVRRIGNDQVERLACQRLEPRALRELHVADAE